MSNDMEDIDWVALLALIISIVIGIASWPR